MKLQHLSERLAMYFQAYTLYSSVRPFGLSAIVAGWDSHPDDKMGLKSQGKPALYVVEPSGVFNVSSHISSIHSQHS
jgi:20S proteasome subunit alpha 7